MAKVLVTGATGFVGTNIARALLLDRRDHVRALVRASSDLRNLEGMNVELCEGDLRDPNSVEVAMRGCDWVFHVAAEYNFWSRDPRTMYESNVEGTRNVMEAALKQGVKRVVYTSTVGTIGLGDLPNPCNELSSVVPNQLTSHYKLSKIEAEKVVLSYVGRGLPVVIVNPSAPIGQWDRKPTPTGRIIVDFARGMMPVFVETGLNLIHVRDVARGHVLAAEKGRVGERYILGNRNLSLGEILALLGPIIGRPTPRVRIPYALAWTAGLISTKYSDWVTKRPPAIALESVQMARKHMYFDSSKAVRELGLPQTPVELALRDAVDWFAAHGYFSKLNEEEISNGDPTQTGNDSWQVRRSSEAQGQ